MSQSRYPAFPVLIIDDSPTFLNSVESGLIFNGLEHVECCHDRKEFMPRLSKGKYSVIVLGDFRLPISGEELLPKIAKDFPDTPVIKITGSIDNKKTSRVEQEVAFACLEKTSHINDIIRTIKNALHSQNALKSPA